MYSQDHDTTFDQIPKGSILIEIEQEELSNSTLRYAKTYKPPSTLTIVGLKFLSPGYNFNTKIYILFFEAKLTLEVLRLIEKIDDNVAQITFACQKSKLYYKCFLQHFLKNNYLPSIYIF